jgi:hypothetical protein
VSDLDELCHTLRAFAERINRERDLAVSMFGQAGAERQVARASVASELLALLPPEEPRS